MSTSTTLMTFLVRVPPTTRSVTLLGSWDNFTTPYVMRRDSRVGAEHWTGCHTFNNIVFDGIGKSGTASRDGGLKMGGTYWYYYKLDDDIEFHNSAEPSTTSCPLLPGQLVNVLHVPFSFASGRPRNASTSSAVSEFRTMDPDAKFLNPRPVPQPKLARLNTSPTFPTFPNSSASSPASASPWSARLNSSSRENSPPTSAASLKLFRLPRKASTVGKSRSTSPGRDRVAGFKATIRSFRAPRSVSPQAEDSRGRPMEANRGADISQPLLVHRPAEEEESSRPATRGGFVPGSRSRSPKLPVELEARPVQRANLALRRGLDQPSEIEQPLPVQSYQQHRRQRSLSRDPSPLRRSMSLSDDHQLREALSELSISRNGALETVKEANSNLNTPQWPLTAIKIPKRDEVIPSISEFDPTLSAEEGKDSLAGHPYLGKRLPTLPNTPSSAYPPSAVENSPSRRLSAQIAKMQEDELKSHFSNSTASNDSTTDSIQVIERSHFSTWTTSTMSSSPASQYMPQFPSSLDEVPLPANFVKISDFPPRGQSLRPGIHEQAMNGSLTHSDALSSMNSFSTIASSVSTSPLSELFEDLDAIHSESSPITALPEMQEKYPKHIQTYSLPPDESPPPMNVSKPMFQDFVNNVNSAKRKEVGKVQPIGHIADQLLPHSESMQQLIDELSYLRTLIES